MANKNFSHKHLTAISDLSSADITHILDVADDYAGRLQKEDVLSNILSDKVILTLFFEDLRAHAPLLIWRLNGWGHRLFIGMPKQAP